MRKLFHDRRGIVALEFALIGPIMMSLAIGTFDLGIATVQNLAVQNGLNVAGTYLMQRDNAGGVVEAVRSSTSLLSNAVITIAPSGTSVAVSISVDAIKSGLIPMPDQVLGSGSFNLKAS